MAGLKTILCIEDEHFISELYSRALTRAGYEVTIMLSGIDGLAAAQTDMYDLILLDLMTPGITGIEVLNRLRGMSDSTPIHSKIIITTNLDEEEAIRDQLETMVDGYLIKAEITPRQLVSIVDQLRDQMTES
jgi:DNA-binding response OmpR family regulator